MTILLTGSEGFIGNRIKQTLLFNGHHVIPFDLVLGNNLLNLNELEQAVKKSDVIMHVAAQANLHKMETLDGGKQGTDFNVQGTHNIALLCAKYHKKLIYASTVCVYGNLKTKATEDVNVNPSDLYAYSKYAGENIIKGYAANFDLKYIILRFATTYGPGMREALGTHIFFSQAIKGEDITVHGDGKQTRTLTHVDDIALGCLCALNNFDKAANNIFNISQSERISAIKMATDIKRITKSKSNIVHITQRHNQTFKENVCNNKAFKLLKWKPAYNWRKGLLSMHEMFK